jgi:predicted RNase H-like nuclease (RuvC/YqgF family)
LDGVGGHRYFAGYAQWEKHKDEHFKKLTIPTIKAAAVKPAQSIVHLQKQNRSLKRELTQLEERIEAGDRQIAELQERMKLPEVAANHVILQDLWQTLETAESDVKALYRRWEELGAELETK